MFVAWNPTPKLRRSIGLGVLMVLFLVLALGGIGFIVIKGAQEPVSPPFTQQSSMWDAFERGVQQYHSHLGSWPTEPADLAYGANKNASVRDTYLKFQTMASRWHFKYTVQQEGGGIVTLRGYFHDPENEMTAAFGVTAHRRSHR
jgi:hypothetical protein